MAVSDYQLIQAWLEVLTLSKLEKTKPSLY